MTHTMIPHKLAKRLAWGLVALTVLGFISMIVLETAGCQQFFNLADPRPATAYGFIMVPIMTLGFAFIGGLIITYHPENRIGWLAIAIAAILSIGLALEAYALCVHNGVLDLPAHLTVLWLSEAMTEWLAIATGLFVMLFPTGRFLSPRWKQFSLILILLSLPFILVSFFWPGQLIRTVPNPAPGIQNPFVLPIEPDPFWEAVVFQVPGTLLFFFVLSAFAALFLRWYRAQGDVRQQIKWVAFFLMTSGTLFIVVEIVGATFYPEIFEGWFYLVELAIFWLGFPLVFGLSIFKYRLYDIDIIIRRTVQYAAVSAVLVATYYGSVILLQTIFTNAVGEQSPLIIVVSTLLTAALFNPLRTRLQTFIDGRFYRRQYNAEQILSQFAQTARDEVELEILTNELVHVVQETMQPDSISLWMRESN